MKVNSGQAPSTLIPEYIGSDFDKVVIVADNLDAVKVTGENITAITNVNAALDSINTVNEHIEEVTVVADNIDYVKDVAEGIEGLPVHSYIGDEPPTQPKEGAEWYCTKDGRTYVWYKDIDSGQWVESSPQSTVEEDLNNLTNIRALWVRSAAEAGFTLVNGSFEVGGVLTSTAEVMWHKTYNKIYSWVGNYPVGGFVVAPNTDPSLDTTNWVSRTTTFLRDQIKPYMDLVALTGDYQDNHVGLNDAINDALEGSRTIVVNKAMAVNGTLLSKDLTEVSFVGSKTIAGPYRKKVVDEFRTPYVPVNTINPDHHLKSLKTTNTPVVVIMGDSISTDGPNALVATNTMWSILKEKLQKDNPSKSFTFHNRAVGGQTWVNANTKPTAFPYWYVNQNNDWLTYIESLQPDVLFLAFGMNDSNGFNSGALFTTINKIKAWVKVPDIVFVTNPVPAQTTIYPDGTGFGFVGQTFQEGRDYAAGYARNYANFYGYGVIDINRSMVAMRDCYDVTSGVMHTVETVVANHYVASRAAYDFAFTSTIRSTDWAEGKVVSVKCGLEADDFLFIKKTAGNFVFEGYVTGIGTYASISTGVAVPAGTFGLEVSVIGGIARLLLDPLDSVENRRVLGEFKVIRHGGIFLPVIGWQGESGGPFTSIQYSTAYDNFNGDAKYQQSVTDSDVWGVSTLDADTKPIYGGNGINHYSAEGLEFVVRPTIEACDFAVGDTMTGVHAGGRWIKHPDGSAEYSKTVTLTGVNITTALGSGFIQPDPVADTDFPQIFMSDGASGYRFETSLHLMSSGGSFAWVITDASSTMNNAIRYRLASLVSVTGATFKVQITMRGRWK